jgi:hypothetical protein
MVAHRTVGTSRLRQRECPCDDKVGARPSDRCWNRRPSRLGAVVSGGWSFAKRRVQGLVGDRRIVRHVRRAEVVATEAALDSDVFDRRRIREAVLQIIAIPPTGAADRGLIEHGQPMGM